MVIMTAHIPTEIEHELTRKAILIQNYDDGLKCALDQKFYND